MATVTAINVSNIENSKNFENRIMAVCPSFVESVEILEAGIQRASGYGQYKYFLEGYLNGEYFQYKKHFTDSQTWEWYQDAETSLTFSNWKKKLIINLLEEYLETV